MKSIYLKAGKTQDVFNDLKDNFNGTLSSNNNEFELIFGSDFASGNITGLSFADGINYIQFDMIFKDDVRLSMELLNTSPIFFAYCTEGSFQHSFGERGERKIIKKQHSAILKSASTVNSILQFQKNIPIKLYVIQVGTNATNSINQNDELIKKLKNTFFHTKENYLNVTYHNNLISEKIAELNALTQIGTDGNLLKNNIVKTILQLEIEQNTDGFSKVAHTINSFSLQRIDEIKNASNSIINLSLELFTTDFLIQKTRLMANAVQKEFKLIFSRTVHDFLIYIRIERGRI